MPEHHSEHDRVYNFIKPEVDREADMSTYPSGWKIHDSTWGEVFNVQFNGLLHRQLRIDVYE